MLGGVSKPVDQKAGLVVDRKAERSLHPLHAARLEPVRGGPEQGCEDGRIVGRFEEAELAGGVAVALEPQPVDLRRNAADREASHVRR